MNISRIINFVLILVGASIAFYAQSQDDKGNYILISGIVLLMMGLYRLSRNISSKTERQDIESKPEEENNV